MSQILIEVTAGDTIALVWSPYAAKDVIKTLPPKSRAWDKEQGCWRIRAGLAGQLAARLREAGYDVVVNRPDPPPPPRDNGTVSGRSWPELMYADVGVPLGDLCHKVLTRVLHPDAGGSEQAMKNLNAARDKAHRRNTR